LCSTVRHCSTFVLGEFERAPKSTPTQIGKPLAKNEGNDVTGKQSIFRDTFTNRHVVPPVIHVATELQALRNTEIAFNRGADGEFLINHSIGSESLLLIHSIVSK